MIENHMEKLVEDDIETRSCEGCIGIQRTQRRSYLLTGPSVGYYLYTWIPKLIAGGPFCDLRLLATQPTGSLHES